MSTSWSTMASSQGDFDFQEGREGWAALPPERHQMPLNTEQREREFEELLHQVVVSPDLLEGDLADLAPAPLGPSSTSNAAMEQAPPAATLAACWSPTDQHMSMTATPMSLPTTAATTASVDGFAAGVNDECASMDFPPQRNHVPMSSEQLEIYFQELIADADVLPNVLEDLADEPEVVDTLDLPAIP
mmetsp:Transcript_16044/g.43283  ORF Transcript_16044/g.43283 Transcript_16044/m.43283 type:complete len:188 (-) Transcript_16044:123-686(-)